MKWRIQLAEIEIGDEEKRAIAKVLDSKWLTMGERTLEFEKLFAKEHGVKYAVAVSSCTAALHLALRAAGVGAGDEVICPSMTFVASSNAALYLGATPIFADIVSLENPTISPDDISRKITPRTKAIVAMHYGGYPCEIEKISRIAKRHSIALIEDAAHAPMVRCGRKMLGTFGDAGCFSFYANKNMTTAEGGMIITNDGRIAEEAQRNRSHGLSHLARERFTAGTVGYDVVDLGYNYRIDEIRSAIGIVQLKRLKKAKPARKRAVEQYQKLLKDIPNLTIPFNRYKGDSAFHLFGVILGFMAPNRDRVIEKMSAAGVQTSNHYTPVHLFKYYRKQLGTHERTLLLTEEYGRRQITLPLYNGMKKKDVKYVVDSLKKALRG